VSVGAVHWGRALRVSGALALVVALAAGGCESPQQPKQRQARRQVALKPVDVAKKRSEKLQAQRLYDEDMSLLPSDDVVAGIRLPRGLTTKLQVENRYYYHSKVPLPHLRAYFGPRLVTMRIVPDGKSTYKYVKAKTKDTDEPHLVNVRIGPTSKSIYVNEVMIQDLSLEPIRKVETFQRSQAQLKALREHAQ